MPYRGRTNLCHKTHCAVELTKEVLPGSNVIVGIIFIRQQVSQLSDLCISVVQRGFNKVCPSRCIQEFLKNCHVEFAKHICCIVAVAWRKKYALLVLTFL